ncbi:MAG: RdgB/HAM1 family non-canonical purine NTP pyrophosphatase [Fibrobacterota bacterium]
MDKIMLATNNKHKISEIKEILSGLDVTLLPLSTYPEVPEVIEDQPTFEGNALKKAWEISLHTGLSALADDSGLEVDVLNGEPGVRSARYSGGNAEDNNRLLLKNLEGVPAEKRTARFRCVVALVVPDQPPIIAEGRVEGRIGLAARGEGGFGYDPLFIPKGQTRTFAEMEGTEKNGISHRGKALTLLRSKMGCV